jgi:hypothetical protein
MGVYQGLDRDNFEAWFRAIIGLPAVEQVDHRR